MPMFQKPAAPRGILMAWQGHFYVRRGKSLVALDMSKYLSPSRLLRRFVCVRWLESKSVIILNLQFLADVNVVVKIIIVGIDKP